MFLSEDVRLFSEQLTQLLAEDPPEAIAVAKAITTFVEAAGTEAPRRRDRMRQTSMLAADHYRHKIRAAAMDEVLSDEQLDMNLYRLQRSLDVRYQVDRNANQATLIESWSVDLQRGIQNH
jgi:DNA polymerase-3 subunit delta'